VYFMLRGVKRKLIKYSDTQEQEVIYVQTPQLAHKQPEPETSRAEVIDTFERFSEGYKKVISLSPIKNCVIDFSLIIILLVINRLQIFTFNYYL